MIRNPFSKQLKSSASVHILHCSMSSGSTSILAVLCCYDSVPNMQDKLFQHELDNVNMRDDYVKMQHNAT